MTAGKNWIDATVRDTREAASSVRVIDIEPDNGARTFATGSHLDVCVLADETAAVRSYSLIGRAPIDGAYRIAVRRLPGGRGGSLYMTSLQPGARLSITEPVSYFELQQGRAEYLLIAGGIGITPIIGMAEALNQAQASFRLAYAGRSRETMPFIEKLTCMLGDRLTLFVSDEGQRINVAAQLQSLHDDGEVYVCGPPGLRDAARRAWAALGRDAVRIRFETFASGGRWPPEAFSVWIDDLETGVTVSENQTMLDALRIAGIEVMWDCLKGECGLCAVPVLNATSELDHRDVFLSDAQQSDGKTICTCVSRARGGAITISSRLLL